MPQGFDKPHQNANTYRDVPLRDRIFTTAAVLFSLVAGPASAEPSKAVETSPFSYADIADATSLAPIVAIATIHKVKHLKGDLVVGLPEGRARFLVTAKVVALLRGETGLPARIEYLLDTPLDAKGRPPKIVKRKVVLAGAPVPGKPASIQLVSSRAQIDWNAEVEARVRAIVTEAIAPNAPPRIIGVGNAFHVRGSLPGESETQIFLKTVGSQPVSLNVLRRPGEEPHWAAALGEMIDDAAKAPQRDTLLWYRLACFLPPALPAASVANLDTDDAAAANADYRYVIGALGACDRTP